jgi:site-specific recombinase XerD
MAKNVIINTRTNILLQKGLRITMDIQKAIDECIADLSLATNTERTYRNGLKKFVDYLQTKKIETLDDVNTITVDHFIFFLPWMDKNFSKQTNGVYGAAAKAFMDYLVITNHLTLSYLDTLRYKKAALRSHRRHEDKLPRFPKKDDVEKMLHAVHNQIEVSPIKERNTALIEFLASSGCRISEVIALNVADIDFINRSTVVTGKGNKERRVFFSPSAADAMQGYWNARGSVMAKDPAFARHDRGAGHKYIKRMTGTTARRIVKDIAVLADVDPTKFSPHYFRHAFAIRVLSETGNLALTQDLLGHKDPKSTRVYAKIHSEDLQEAHHQIFK